MLMPSIATACNRRHEGVGNTGTSLGFAVVHEACKPGEPPTGVVNVVNWQPAALAEAVGRRVVVRRILDETERGPHGERLTDVVGILEDLDGDALVVRRRGAESVRIPRASVVAFKVIPARAVPRRDIRAVELAASGAWRGVDRTALGDWQLRAAEGFTGRANSCLPIGDPGLAMNAAVDWVVDWYAARSLPPRFQLPVRLTEDVDRLLQARDWASSRESMVMTRMPPPVVDAVAAAGPSPYRVVVADDLSDEWLEMYQHYRQAPLPPIAETVLRDADGPVGFAHAYAGATVAGIGRGAVTADPTGRRWLGLTAIVVVPAYRRRGVARLVIGALTAWGVDLGADAVYVQVSAGNEPAVRLYEALGLTEHHRYHYRRPTDRR
jgi:N-acetylglutamate synthase